MPRSLAASCALLLLTLTTPLAALDLTDEEAQALREAGPPDVAIGFLKRGGGKVTIPKVDRDKVIGFCLYTSESGVLKLSAQLYPLTGDESREVTLEIDRGAGFVKQATQSVDEDHWTTSFRVEGWDASKPGRYRVSHPGGAVYEGVLRADPVGKDVIVVGALSCNSNTDRGPRADIVRNLKAQDPDLLFFAGDQSYDHKEHLAAWLLFGRQFGEIMRDRPTVTIPDDHDVGQGNLWGEGGKASSGRGGAADGGYVMPLEYVKMVERAQTSHLPDPWDPTPVERGIGVYYTRLRVGGVDFAILEDRKFKTGPMGLVPDQGPRPDHVSSPDYDPQAIDVPEAVLLGERQLRFLDEWGQDWDGAAMKCVLSQTIFAGGAHIHGKSSNRLVADLDSNGWPQTGRNKALLAMRRSYAFHIAGDQHLATVIHHGVNGWEDAGWSFCVPSIVNYYGRWWWPLEQPRDGTIDGNPLPFTGRYHDGFRNKVTMHAYANPAPGNHQAAGYGVVRFDKRDRSITMECWPRQVDVTDTAAEQFPGWPKTISQQDNYAREPMAHLPTLKITGGANPLGGPVVQVIDEGLCEVVYTLRILGDEFRPPVYRAETTYTVKVTSGAKIRTLTGVKPVGKRAEKFLKVDL